MKMSDMTVLVDLKLNKNWNDNIVFIFIMWILCLKNFADCKGKEFDQHTDTCIFEFYCL